MAGSKGVRQNIGVTHREVLSWLRTAATGEDFRAGKGLYLRKTEGGAFWTLRFASPDTGSQRRVPLWSDEDGAVRAFPEASLEEANIRAARLREIIAAGIDPVQKAQDDAERAVRTMATERAAADAARQIAEAEQARRVTVRQLFTRWAGTELKPHTRADGTRTGRKDGGEYTRLQFERHVFPSIGDLVVSEVKKSDLLAILDSIKSTGRLRTANVLLADLKQMFRFALTRELVDRNPLDVVTKRDAGGLEAPRERVLSAAEIKKLSTAVPLAKMHRRSACAIWLLLSTACRVGEAMGARWEHFTLKRDDSGQLVSGSWYLPTTKNERDHTIHLSAFALSQVETLLGLREAAPASDGGTLERVPWVFPNSASTGPVDIKSFGKQLADRQRDPEDRLSGRSKNTEALRLPGGRWTAHDLRRTAGTIMAGLGTSGDVIDECLNHVIESRVRRTYIRDRREDDQARAFDALGAHLARLVDGKDAPSNVVPIAA